jgi:hypothetical protein
MPSAEFDTLPGNRISAEGAEIRIGYGPGTLDLPRERIVEYVRSSAHSVAVYFGQFPVRNLRILILTASGPGRPVRSGMAFGHHGAAIKLTLAADASARDLAGDWILVHEMCHLALPSLPRAQHWFEEGMASYVEPLARAQAGVLDVKQVWADMVQGMPQGLPQAGDRGLDHTPTWGRTYWGGALFCLLADIGIREATSNRAGLQHALRAMLAQGNMEQDAQIAPLLQTGDLGVGVPVLSALYEQMKDRPVPVDLDALWQRLGVERDPQGVHFDDAAPLAALRAALTRAIAPKRD